MSDGSTPSSRRLVSSPPPWYWPLLIIPTPASTSMRRSPVRMRYPPIVNSSCPSALRRSPWWAHGSPLNVGRSRTSRGFSKARPSKTGAIAISPTTCADPHVDIALTSPLASSLQSCQGSFLRGHAGRADTRKVPDLALAVVSALLAYAVVPNPLRPSCSTAASRRRYFWILPVTVIGKSSMLRT